MTSPRALHVRCSTWEQVDAFLTRKLRKGRFLSMKVPFVGEVGVPVTLGLELPNQLVVAIDGTVQQASPIDREASGARSWIEIELAGLTPEVFARIRSLKNGAEAEDDPRASAPIQVAPAAPPRTSIATMGEDLPEDERTLFQHLTGELRRLRQAAVHEVLGVSAGAKPEEVRAAWQKNVRRFHPDLVARRRAPAISHLAEELTILTNRAYDRLRAALAAEGQIALAGPSLALQPGWLVGFDDISSGEAKPPPKKVERPAAPPAAKIAPPAASSGAAASGVEAFEQRARTMLGQGDANNAREVLAAALVVYPRSKPLRSMYYVASAFAALQEGEVVLATAQLETALAHHEQCREASQLLEHVRKHGADANDAARRYFG
jgi:hypothetical protein